MNPHQKNKIDINTLSPDEQRLFRLYGKLPNKRDLLQNKLKERKYFDSGDYALSKAGKASDTGVTTIGTEHPQAENIPHHSASSPPNSATLPATGGSGSISIGGGQDGGSPFSPGVGGHRGSIPSMHGRSIGMRSGHTRSPVKESSFPARSASMDGGEEAEAEKFDFGEEGKEGEGGLNQMSISPPPMKEGLPIRR